MRGAIFAATATVILLAGCTSDPTEELTGCFSMSSSTDRPTIQITEDDDKYLLSTRNDGMWSAAQPLAAADSALIQQIFGADAAKVKAGLGLPDRSVTLFKLEAGEKIAGGTADSGFIGAFFFGTGQVYKTDSCD
ncbi:MAG: hypothetical protein WA888_22140 [Burkholderiaceae bacterium]